MEDRLIRRPDNLHVVPYRPYGAEDEEGQPGQGAAGGHGGGNGRGYFDDDDDDRRDYANEGYGFAPGNPTYGWPGYDFTAYADPQRNEHRNNDSDSDDEDVGNAGGYRGGGHGGRGNGFGPGPGRPGRPGHGFGNGNGNGGNNGNVNGGNNGGRSRGYFDDFGMTAEAAVGSYRVPIRFPDYHAGSGRNPAIPHQNGAMGGAGRYTFDDPFADYYVPGSGRNQNFPNVGSGWPGMLRSPEEEFEEEYGIHDDLYNPPFTAPTWGTRDGRNPNYPNAGSGWPGMTGSSLEDFNLRSVAGRGRPYNGRDPESIDNIRM